MISSLAGKVSLSSPDWAKANDDSLMNIENNGLGNNAVNIGKLLNYKNIYFIPFRQDNPITKPNSLVFDKNYIQKTIEMALNKEQIQPILL